MKSKNRSQTADTNNPSNHSRPLPNPYTLFLILILLINSFGGINRIMSNIKNTFSKEGEGRK
ncbi:MAG TPA: hypothetical protein GX514_03340 [Thermoanaerobacterales bacterium]|uniref:hypothetical protein n=1 Tax=Tepidanaerobacter sp. GT38 TaxID=2722793 RepID=UPI0017F851C8|nr:hypothetical protein [Tepidanaerobacter sp. GT38]MCG1012779.1 hypothetical protein [Tepidanaerobacter sp. GT38]HHY41867.1 hypothetical protein [Thermoanaerobacterales bacterium]